MHLTDPTSIVGTCDFHTHDLRRTFGSYQAQLGANETIIQKTLGDKSRAAAAVYTLTDTNAHYTIKKAAQG